VADVTMREATCTIMDAAGPLRLGYVEWGDPEASRTVLCIHGLTRNARDFDFLAAALAAEARVIAVDVAGRGRSAWLADPARYVAPTYIGHMAALLANLGLAEVDLVGTSMGGIIGMGLATLPTAPGGRPLIRRLVLNDIGGLAPAASLEPIAAYLGAPAKKFPDLATLEQHLRYIHQGFGPLSDAEWAHLARHSARPLAGGYVMHYDPAIAAPFVGSTTADLVLWPFYDLITCPTLVLRGGESQLLPAEVAEAMTTRGPQAELVTFAGIGHAPALMAEDQIDVVRRFLAA
jgi:pimeloyl-ACP methyl ester carboxylesterase